MKRFLVTAMARRNNSMAMAMTKGTEVRKKGVNGHPSEILNMPLIC
jgi:hypothetical protein